MYRLWVEGYQGNATDSLGSHNGYAFSTFDRDNDEAPVSFHQKCISIETERENPAAAPHLLPSLPTYHPPDPSSIIHAKDLTVDRFFFSRCSSARGPHRSLVTTDARAFAAPGCSPILIAAVLPVRPCLRWRMVVLQVGLFCAIPAQILPGESKGSYLHSIS